MENDYPDESRLSLVYEKPYGKVYIMKPEKVMICVLLDDYVPIRKFKEIFNAMTDFVKEYGIKKFIFDKRHLRAFHQPSMEWYFVDWKMEMYELGLDKHRKILPKGQDWFRDAVDAGRDRIMRKHPNLELDKLDIQYRNGVDEAIED